MSKQDRRRRPRPRPTPKWLINGSEMDQVAQRRCLMLLSVLSGEKPVTEAIAEADISRQLYYQLETRALEAMLRALTPSSEDSSGSSGASRLAELEAKVTKLEREKRRAERLLFLTRKTVQVGGLKAKPGRPRVRRLKPLSTSSGGEGSTPPPRRTGRRRARALRPSRGLARQGRPLGPKADRRRRAP